MKYQFAIDMDSWQWNHEKEQTKSSLFFYLTALNELL